MRGCYIVMNLIMIGGEIMNKVEFQDIKDSAIIYVELYSLVTNMYETLIYKRKLLTNETYSNTFYRYNEVINRYYVAMDELEVFEELKHFIQYDENDCKVVIDYYEDVKVIEDEFDIFKTVANY